MSFRILKETLQKKELQPRDLNQRSRNWWLILYLVLTTSFFIARVVFFVASYGGIETDSGWYLGVAKNLATRDIYASYTNTIPQEGIGPYPSINGDGRLSVQDENGFSHFPAAISAGPGYVVPEALLLKFFGIGWWQYRLWPLISYAGLLFFLFYILWTIGGMLSLLIVQIWLWATPQLTITFAYESFSEHTAFFYLLIAFFFFAFHTGERERPRYSFLSGFFVSLAILTKLVYAVTVLVIIPMMMWELYKARKHIRPTCVRWLVFLFGFTLPVFLFEFYRFIALIPQFGLEGWKASIEDLYLGFIHRGSGASSAVNFSWPFISEKLRIWSNAAIEPSWIAWSCFLLSPAVFIAWVPKSQWRLIYLMYATATVTLLWFVLISPTGWARHAWHGLILAMMAIGLCLGIIVQRRFRNFTRESAIVLILMVAVIGVSVRLDKVDLKPFLNLQTIDKWRLNRKLGKALPHAAILSQVDQQEVIDFFRDNILKEDRVYYLGVFAVAEMSTLVDKVFFPFGRYLNNNCQNPAGGSSYVIIGPYEQGLWSIVPAVTLKGAINKCCEEAVFSNQSYSVWTLKKKIE